MRKLVSTPTFRSATLQLCGAFPYYCLKFAFGAALGFQIILLAELYKKGSEIYVTIDQLTWLASLTFLTPVGNIITGFLTQRLGNRIMAFVTATLYVAAFLLYYYSANATMIFAGNVLSKLAATDTLAAPYISEISEPQLRGPFIAVAHMSSMVGSFFSVLLGSLVYWRNIAFVNLAIPISAAVVVLVTPNSPAWLASKGRLDEAEKALCWLRGWVQPNRVETEFRSLVESVEKSRATALNATTADSQQGTRAFFLERSFYLPLGTMCLIFVLHDFGGVSATYVYSTIVFQKFDSPIDAPIATVIFGTVGILGNLITLLVIRRTGKRKLAFFTLAVVVLCYASIAIVGFLKLENEYRWIPPIAVILANFADISGAATIVYMLVGEIFPSPVRYIGTSISMAVNSINLSLMNKLFLYGIDAITLPGVFLLFATVNLVALLTYYFLFPETEGSSLSEIEARFKAAKSTDELGK